MKNYNIIDEVLSVNEFAWSLYNSNPLNQRKNNMGTPEVKLLLENLHKKNVKYLLIGGFAMAFHGYVRATNDIDLWIKNTPQNMDALRQALIETGIKEAAFMKSTTQLLD